MPSPKTRRSSVIGVGVSRRDGGWGSRPNPRRIHSPAEVHPLRLPRRPAGPADPPLHPLAGLAACRSGRPPRCSVETSMSRRQHRQSPLGRRPLRRGDRPESIRRVRFCAERGVVSWMITVQSRWSGGKARGSRVRCVGRSGTSRRMSSYRLAWSQSDVHPASSHWLCTSRTVVDCFRPADVLHGIYRESGPV